jgi:hypothetical protein
MRLDELKYRPSGLGCDFSEKAREKAYAGPWEVYRNADGTGQYGIYHQNREKTPKYHDLDPITAQAVLYELLKPTEEK